VHTNLPQFILYNKMKAGFEGHALNSNNVSNLETAIDVNQETKEPIRGHPSSASSTEGYPEVDDEYPSGLKLMFIGVALLLSVFLVGTLGKTSLSLVGSLTVTGRTGYGLQIPTT
jgi:hypothetical protein